MGDNVISLSAAREERQPHWSGSVKCQGCKHEWVGVAPMGTIDSLQCPSCDLPKGVVKNLFGPSVGDAVLQCDCGADVVYIYQRKADGLSIVRCVNCGNDLTQAAFGA